ncbi:fatty acid desaturase [Pendulispora albinea]|uniref:Fatty acid desaturase n=1 Tax=Pendulispora albinea TaxID=2741071 RepID=A0ABZ2LMC7_9BACT
MAAPASPGPGCNAVELPTVAVGLSVYLLWLTLTATASSLPWWLVALAGGGLIAWHGSFQHETIHGHPTRSPVLNALFGSVPLGLWLPYGIYREQHQAHHRTSQLTDPLDDPESFYVTREAWAAMGTLQRIVHRAQTTLAGRLLLGPAWMVGRFLWAELRALLAGDYRHARAWLAHGAGLALVLGWLIGICDMPLGRYVALFVYPGLGLTLLRSFLEHRPAAQMEHRIGVVEAGPLFGLLYLNNNLHAVHHQMPGVPWYELPAHYRSQRTAVLEGNGGFVFPGYLAVLARFAFRPKDPPVHPW